jgi:RimJ/RimL family protein N-acetyltransferase
MVAMHDDSFGLLRTYKHRQNDTFITFDEELLKKVLLLHGEQVDLVFCTNALWHEIYQKYVPDEMMDTTPYQYDYDNFEKAYNIKTSDVTRQYFAILHKGGAIGLIYLKQLNFDKLTTEFGVALNDDSVKGRGFGTEAIKLLIDYAFDTLALETIFADTVHRNTRSQYVLKKVGFRFTHEDETFQYYRLDKSHRLH